MAYAAHHRAGQLGETDPPRPSILQFITHTHGCPITYYIVYNAHAGVSYNLLHRLQYIRKGASLIRRPTNTIIILS
jgi:hypothetical protein